MKPPIPPLVPEGAEFAFGGSPFHVKGVLYSGTQSYFERQVPGGMAALLAEMGEGPLADFISQKFLASTRYDVMPVPALIAYEARTVGKSIADYLQGRTTWQAEQDIHGVYRVMLRIASPERVIQRLPRLLIQMFDFATADLEDHGEGVRVARFSGIPAPLEEWVRVAFAVYAQTAVRLAGAKDTDVSFLDSEDGARKAGLVLRTLRLRVAWT